MAKATASPEAQLEGFIRKFTPAIAAQLREAVQRMRTRLPGAVMPVYDNYNALAICFASGEESGRHRLLHRRLSALDQPVLRAGHRAR